MSLSPEQLEQLLGQLTPPPTEINDTHKVYSIAVVCIILCLIATSFTFLRLYQRWHSKILGPDDWAMIPAILLYIGWTAMAAYVNLHAGVGKPLWEITVPEYSVWFKGIIGAAFLYPAMSASIRISILLFYRRIFANTKPLLTYTIWTMLALQAVYVVINSIMPGFICRPLYTAFDPYTRPFHMDNWFYYRLEVGLFSTSMAFDIILLVMPIYPIMTLQMPLRARAGVVTIFMLGATASIVAAYKLGIFVQQMTRIYSIDPIWQTYQMSLLIPPQFDEYGRTFWIPSQIEPTVALIGTSLPAIRSLFSQQEASKNPAYEYPSTSAKSKSGGSRDKSIVSYIRHPMTKTNNTHQELDSEEAGLRGNYVELYDNRISAR